MFSCQEKKYQRMFLKRRFMGAMWPTYLARYGDADIVVMNLLFLLRRIEAEKRS